MWFQSLLSWISDSNLSGNKYSASILRFNPCYRGLVIRTITALLDTDNDTCFNPCYRGLVIRTYGTFMLAYSIYVSILVIVD